ncbi:hypothetical protein KIN20_036204 [Parelaphostrongylus tenuis]|uniref:Uncharacterized protein n=1 Tax=Parelaphostrongylus tenuis TaxID=148309 RepID=A0AAD5WL15_PARTN|nr:hypothetical protein KIN20_036204 [Parelaphostrongylus tenuis]
MGKKSSGTSGGDPVSFTDVGGETAAGGEKATGSAMMDLISGLQKKKGSAGGDSSTSATSTGKGKKKGKKGKKGKTVTKRKRRKDRYESQNYLLRIEGTLCCSTISKYTTSLCNSHTKKSKKVLASVTRADCFLSDKLPSKLTESEKAISHGCGLAIHGYTLEPP